MHKVWLLPKDYAKNGYAKPQGTKRNKSKYGAVPTNDTGKGHNEERTMTTPETKKEALRQALIVLLAIQELEDLINDL